MEACPSRSINSQGLLWTPPEQPALLSGALQFHFAVSLIFDF
jgi:hypothetical protein